MTYTRTNIVIFIVLLGAMLLGLTHIASAQEPFNAPREGRPGGAALRAEVHASTTPPARATLQEERTDFRERALEGLRTLREDHLNLQGDIRADKQEQRAEVRAELDTAETPEERQAILEAARAEYAQLREAALEKREAFRDRAAALRSELQQQRAELRVEVRTQAASRAKVHLESILEHIGTTLEKFASILERMHNKIASLEADGVDTTEVTVAVQKAEAALTVASDKLAVARTTFTLTLESDEPETFMTGLKEAVRDASAAVKDVYAALRSAHDSLQATSSQSATVKTNVDATI